MAGVWTLIALLSIAVIGFTVVYFPLRSAIDGLTKRPRPQTVKDPFRN